MMIGNVNSCREAIIQLAVLGLFALWCVAIS